MVSVDDVMIAAENWRNGGSMSQRAVRAIRDANISEDEKWKLIAETLDAFWEHAARGVEADMRAKVM